MYRPIATFNLLLTNKEKCLDPSDIYIYIYLFSQKLHQLYICNIHK